MATFVFDSRYAPSGTVTCVAYDATNTTLGSATATRIGSGSDYRYSATIAAVTDAMFGSVSWFEGGVYIEGSQNSFRATFNPSPDAATGLIALGTNYNDNGGVNALDVNDQRVSIPNVTDISNRLERSGGPLLVTATNVMALGNSFSTFTSFYTAARAAKLDNLDGTISGVSNKLGPYSGIGSDNVKGQVGGIGAGTGTGARTVVITVNDGTALLQGATVRLTKAAETYVGTTNTSGQITFAVNDGTWTVAIALAGYTLTPSALLVAGNVTQTYSMTKFSISPATAPGQTNAYLYTYDGGGTLMGNVPIQFTLLRKAMTASSFDGSPFTATSSAGGLLQVPLLQDANYEAQRGNGSSVRFQTSDALTFALPTVLGRL